MPPPPVPSDLRAVTLLIRLVVGLAALTLTEPSLAADGIEELWRQTHWGESANALAAAIRRRVRIVLPRALDFGDSYVDVVLPSRIDRRRADGGVFPDGQNYPWAEAHPARAAAPRCQPTRFSRNTGSTADRLWQPGPVVRHPSTSRERVSGSGRSAVASGRRRRQRDLSRHDPPSVRGLPLRSRHRIVRADRPAVGTDRSTRR